MLAKENINAMINKQKMELSKRRLTQEEWVRQFESIENLQKDLLKSEERGSKKLAKKFDVKMSVKAEQEAVKKMRSPQQSVGQSKIFHQIIPANGSYGGTVDDDTISTISNSRLNKESFVNLDRPIRSEQPSFISQNRSQMKVRMKFKI